jgi:prepilin signal peptidase PulO-like enzyme (type II secretory pathway)
MVGFGMIVTLFVLGLVVGSFLNVVVYRLNHGLSPLRGRSLCPECKHRLAWHDNIPLLSFVWLGGKCRYCHSPISVQYPLVELTTGLLTLLIFNFQFSIFNLILTWALIAIFVSDLRYYTIPEEIVWPMIFLSLLFCLYPHILISNLVSGLGAAGFFLLLVFVTRGKGIGLGDVKLAGLMGLALGWPKVVVAILLAFLTGAAVGVILILMGKKSLKSHIPFGPFLAAATWISLFWGSSLWIF